MNVFLNVSGGMLAGTAGLLAFGAMLTFLLVVVEDADTTNARREAASLVKLALILGLCSAIPFGIASTIGGTA